jgi:hypothetical protein
MAASQQLQVWVGCPLGLCSHEDKLTTHACKAGVPNAFVNDPWICLLAEAGVLCAVWLSVHAGGLE